MPASFCWRVQYLDAPLRKEGSIRHHSDMNPNLDNTKSCLHNSDRKVLSYSVLATIAGYERKTCLWNPAKNLGATSLGEEVLIVCLERHGKQHCRNTDTQVAVTFWSKPPPLKPPPLTPPPALPSLLPAPALASLGRHYLSNATCRIQASFVSCAVDSVRDHRALQNESPPLKKTRVRQVVLDKWLPLILRMQRQYIGHSIETCFINSVRVRFHHF